jgi:hypothetical protein
MAGRKPSSLNRPLNEDVLEWALVATRSDENGDEVADWVNPNTNETITLPATIKPTPAILKALRLNDVAPATRERVLASDELDDTELPDSSTDRVLSIIKGSDAESSTQIKIYRVRDGIKDAYCGQFTPEEFEEKNLELIRSYFGGGKYRIRVYGKHSSGKFGVLANEVVEIEESILPTALPGITPAPQNQRDIVIEKLFQRIDDMDKRQQAPQNDMMQQLRMFAMIKQMFGDTGPKSSLAELLEGYKLIESLKGDGGNQNGGDGLMGMASQFLDVLKNAPVAQPLETSVQTLPTVQVPATLATTPQPVPSPDYRQPQESEGATVNVGQDFMMRVMLKAILAKAKLNAPIEPIAKDLVDKLPDEALDMLETDLWFEMLQEIIPEVAAHQIWFTKLRDNIIALSYEDAPVPGADKPT